MRGMHEQATMRILRGARIWLAAWALVSCLAAFAGPVAAAAAPAPPTPEQVRALTQLLADPAVRQWLQQQAEAAPAADPGYGFFDDAPGAPGSSATAAPPPAEAPKAA